MGVLDVGFNDRENLGFTPSAVTRQLIRNHGNHVLGIIGAKWDTQAGVRGCTPFAHLNACTIAEISQQFPLNLSCEKKTICNILFGNWLWQ